MAALACASICFSLRPWSSTRCSSCFSLALSKRISDDVSASATACCAKTCCAKIWPAEIRTPPTRIPFSNFTRNLPPRRKRHAHIAPQSGCVHASSDQKTGVQAPIFRGSPDYFYFMFCSRRCVGIFLKAAERARSARIADAKYCAQPGMAERSQWSNVGAFELFSS
jgi:hypothetical protein